MNVMHRIIFRSNNKRTYEFFSNLDLKIKTNAGLSIIIIGENHIEWDKIRNFINDKTLEITDFQLETHFTKTEMEHADFFAIHPSWHFEYPQPKENFVYEAITYNPENVCKNCGIKLKPINSFEIKKNPKWGKRNIVQLNWIFDEYFVSCNLKNQLEKNSDIKFKSVNNYKTKIILDDIFQINIYEYIDLNMPAGTDFEQCKICKQIKYLPHTRGFFPSPKSSNFTITHSVQSFGSACNSYHAVLINKDIYNLFNRIGVNGISYTPCCANSAIKKQGN